MKEAPKTGAEDRLTSPPVEPCFLLRGLGESKKINKRKLERGDFVGCVNFKPFAMKSNTRVGWAF